MVYPVTAGRVCEVQVVPFQTAPVLPLTDSQKSADVHDSEPRLTFAGRDCGCHDVPFQTSANVELPPPSVMQNVAEAHDTAPSMAIVALAGIGVDCGVHTVPFHISANGTVPDAPKYWPTASQNVAEVHDTWCRVAESEPAGKGTDCDAQEVPSHVSAMMPEVEMPLL